MQQISILVVEDDADISAMLVELLTGRGYLTHAAYSGTEGLMCLERDAYDVLLLDLMLPGMKGEEVLKRVKTIQEDLIVIVVSAIDDTQTKISVLKNGADDYITKPFHTEELLARIEASLRHISKSGPRLKNVLVFRDLKLNTDTFEVTVSDHPVILTKREYQILELLMSNPHKVFTKNNIFESVWNEEFVGEDNAVNVHISNIRQKLSKFSDEETYIQTVWGIGFKMKT